MTHEIVQAERDRQIAKGFDAAHDDKMGREHLIYWAKVYAEGGQTVEAAALLVALAEFDFRNTPEQLVGTGDAEPDGSDQLVTSGEVIGRSHDPHRAPSFAGTPGSEATGSALLEIARIYQTALRNMDGRNTAGPGDDALDAIAEVLVLAGVDMYGFPGGRDEVVDNATSTGDALQSLREVISSAITSEDGRYIADVMAEYVWAAGYRKGERR